VHVDEAIYDPDEAAGRRSCGGDGGKERLAIGGGGGWVEAKGGRAGRRRGVLRG
jgi:hypothetical protein